MIKHWILASRPKTLTGAAAPVLVGGAMAYHDTLARVIQGSRELYVDGMDSSVYLGAHAVRFAIPFALCLLFAFLMQIDANFVNDLWDFKKGTDREDRLGPERACAQGWIKPGAMAWGIGITTLLSCMVGLVIFMWNLQWELFAVGVACVLGCFLYTLKLSYLGFGDLLVLLFFGVVPVGFTYYVITGGGWTLPVTLAGLGMGLATDTLLIVNNYRDRVQDKQSGKKTIIVRWGKLFGLKAYFWLGVAAAILSATATLLADATYTSLFTALYLCFHFSTYSKMKTLEGKELNGILGKTARNIFLYGVLFALGLIL